MFLVWVCWCKFRAGAWLLQGHPVICVTSEKQMSLDFFSHGDTAGFCDESTVSVPPGCTNAKVLVLTRKQGQNPAVPQLFVLSKLARCVTVSRYVYNLSLKRAYNNKNTLSSFLRQCVLEFIPLENLDQETKSVKRKTKIKQRCLTVRMSAPHAVVFLNGRVE